MERCRFPDRPFVSLTPTDERSNVQYVLLINDPPETFAHYEDFGGPLMREYEVFSREVAEAGVMVGGAALRAPETATTVRERDGKTLTTDGPYTETKELLGGYYVIDVESLDEAIEWAGKCPAARTGSVEVRPLMVMPEPAR